MKEAKSLRSKYSKIALEDDKGREVDLAMRQLEDPETMRKIQETQIKREIDALNERRRLAAERAKRQETAPFKKSPTPRTQQQENLSERSLRLSIVDRARAVYGPKLPPPKPTKARQSGPARKPPQLENLLNKYISMGAEEIRDPEITQEMRSLKIT